MRLISWLIPNSRYKKVFESAAFKNFLLLQIFR